MEHADDEPTGIEDTAAPDESESADAPTESSPVVETTEAATTGAGSTAKDTTEVPAAAAVTAAVPTDATTPPTTPSSNINGRTIGIGAAAIALLGIAFFAGMAVRDQHDDDRGGRFMAARGAGLGGAPGEPGARPDGQHVWQRGGGKFGGHERGGARPGGRGGGDRGGHAGGPPGGHAGRGGAMGVVTGVSKDSLTLDPIHGDGESMDVTFDDDTRIVTRGDDGPRDVENADIDDIDEGDIIAVIGARGDAAGDDKDTREVTAKTIMLLRDADE